MNKTIVFQSPQVVMYKVDKPFIEKGEYKPTQIDDQKQKADMLITACNGGSYTIDTKGIGISGRGVKCRYQNGCYEVTEPQLKKLQAKYNVMTYF